MAIVRAICIAITAGLVWAVVSLVPSLIKDIPHIVRGEYLQAEGVVLYNELGGAKDRVQDREIYIEDKATGTEIMLCTLETGVYEGEYIKATYLPNSGIATINERK